MRKVIRLSAFSATPKIRGCSESQYLGGVGLITHGLPSKSHTRGGTSMPPRTLRIMSRDNFVNDPNCGRSFRICGYGKKSAAQSERTVQKWKAS